MVRGGLLLLFLDDILERNLGHRRRRSGCEEIPREYGHDGDDGDSCADRGHTRGQERCRLKRKRRPFLRNRNLCPFPGVRGLVRGPASLVEPPKSLVAVQTDRGGVFPDKCPDVSIRQYRGVSPFDRLKVLDVDESPVGDVGEAYPLFLPGAFQLLKKDVHDVAGSAGADARSSRISRTLSASTSSWKGFCMNAFTSAEKLDVSTPSRP